MSTTINIICYKQKTLANGKNPLMIRFCKDGKKKYISLGISVLPQHLDFTKNTPKRNCPNKELIQKIINEHINKYSEQLLTLKASSKDFTVNSLIEKVNPVSVKKCTILAWRCITVIWFYIIVVLYCITVICWNGRIGWGSPYCSYIHTVSNITIIIFYTVIVYCILNTYQ